MCNDRLHHEVSGIKMIKKDISVRTKKKSFGPNLLKLAKPFSLLLARQGWPAKLVLEDQA
jgi:hypothetical protein